jgi:hypothetical protein
LNLVNDVHRYERLIHYGALKGQPNQITGFLGKAWKGNIIDPGLPVSIFFLDLRVYEAVL